MTKTLDPQITFTFIGKEYGWDRVSDADPRLLRQNRESLLNVLHNPQDFPKADFMHIQMKLCAIDEFFFLYGKLLDQFA